MNYPLATDTWNWREKFAILRVMRSGRYTMGPEVAKFENEFAKKMEVRNAVMTNSGSSANLVGLAALVYLKEIPAGSEVIVPAVSWSTTYFPITQLGLVPVFVDVGINSFNLTLETVRGAITKKTCAVFAVNLLGLPCQLTELRQLCDDNDIYLMEDNCESLGALYDVKQAGTFGEFGTFSFFFSHHIQTMEGGMIVTDDDELADYMRSIRAHGWVRDVRTDHLYAKGSVDPFNESFHFVLPGYCVRPLEMSGAIGSVQLTKMDRMIDARRKNAETFTKLFGDDFHIQTENRRMKSSWFGFGVVLKEDRTVTREALLTDFKRAKIEVRPIVAGNFTNQPVLAYMKHRIVGPLTNAQMLDKNGFFFGNDWRPLKKKIVATRKLIG